MALRIKTVWFRNAGGRSAAEVSSVIASTIWRLADETVASLSKADFDIVTPERGMRILGEMAAFLLHMTDRMLYGRVPEAERAQLVQHAGRRLAGIVEENVRQIVGEDGFDYKANFIGLLNRRAADYAAFDATPERPGFPILRYLGLAVREVMLESDQHWVADQIMDVLAPEALGALKKQVDGLLSQPDPGRPRRSVVSGD
jgi:hypothetical protein